MNGVNPNVAWCEKLGGNNLRFTFGEKLTEREAEQAIVLWKNAFQQNRFHGNRKCKGEFSRTHQGRCFKYIQ